MKRLPLVPLLLGLIVLLPASLNGQGVQGFVVHAGELKPVPGAHIRLLRGTTLLQQAFADSMGGFLMRTVKGGTYTLEVQGFGLELLREDISLKQGEISEIRLLLGPRPVKMPGITVEGRRRDVTQDASYLGMHARRMAQTGPLASRMVYMRGDGEFDASSNVAEVLRWGALNGKCIGSVFWNGHPSLAGGWLTEMNLTHIEAVEVFRDVLSAPREFRSFASIYAASTHERPFSAGASFESSEFTGLRGSGLGAGPPPANVGVRRPSASIARASSGSLNCGVLSLWSRRTGD